MKNKILGPILLALLIVGSSDVMAEVDPALERDLGVSYFCGEVYKHYGSRSSFYPIELAELGIAMRKAADSVAEKGGASPGDMMVIHSTAVMNFAEKRDKLPPIIPNELDVTCTYMAGVLGVL